MGEYLYLTYLGFANLMVTEKKPSTPNKEPIEDKKPDENQVEEKIEKPDPFGGYSYKEIVDGST